MDMRRIGPVVVHKEYPSILFYLINERIATIDYSYSWNTGYAIKL